MGDDVAEHVPGLLIFGANGGGEAFAFDTGSRPAPFLGVPFVPMSLADAVPLGPTFTAFLEACSPEADLAWARA